MWRGNSILLTVELILLAFQVFVAKQWEYYVIVEFFNAIFNRDIDIDRVPSGDSRKYYPIKEKR